MDPSRAPVIRVGAGEPESKLSYGKPRPANNNGTPYQGTAPAASEDSVPLPPRADTAATGENIPIAAVKTLLPNETTRKYEYCLIYVGRPFFLNPARAAERMRLASEQSTDAMLAIIKVVLNYSFTVPVLMLE
jgi:hypothetical protein